MTLKIDLVFYHTRDLLTSSINILVIIPKNSRNRQRQVGRQQNLGFIKNVD